MNALYNEIDLYAAEWTRNLIAAARIAPGVVDERSIRELQPDDVRGAVQFHAFAGIGVWSYALRLAGWPDDRPVWTGSCPCQPFSAAGRRGGFADERHLWPEWFRLIRECRPAIIFGEQVASPDGLGWFDAVSTDLEGAGYAVGAADICAASVGAPHIRQRLYFVAVADGERCERRLSDGARSSRQGGPQAFDYRIVGNTSSARSGRDSGAVSGAQGEGAGERRGAGRIADESELASATRGSWSGAEWIPCRDRKWRPVEPGSFPLASISADRVGRGQSRLSRVAARNRTGRLRGYGNAITAEIAAAFVRAVMEIR